MSFRNQIKQVQIIIKREIQILSSNVPMLLLLFAAPIAYSFLYTSIFVNKLERDVPVLVIDNDGSQKSREFIRYLDAHELIQVTNENLSINEAYSQLEMFKYMAIIIIPKGFQSKIITGEQAKISVSVNNTRFMITNDIVKGVNDVLSSMADGATIDYFKKRGLNSKSAENAANPFVLTSEILFNTTESYGDFIIVALLALILQQTLLIGVAVSVAHERECNTIPDLLHKISGSVIKLIFGKAGIYFIIYCLYAALFFTLHYQLFKLPFAGSMSVLALTTFFQFIAIILTALIVGTFFPSKLVALIVLVFSSYPVFLLSGYSWPIQAFPPLLKVIAYMLPHTSYFQAYTCITQQGGGLADILPQIIRIISISVVLYFVLFLRIRYLKKHNSGKFVIEGQD